jgi:hypothetical protein
MASLFDGRAHTVSEKRELFLDLRGRKEGRKEGSILRQLILGWSNKGI